MVRRLNSIGFQSLTAALFVLLISGFFFSVDAQDSGSLEGRVVDFFDKRPLSTVEIKIQDLNLTTLTADDGSYDFGSIPAGEYIVHLSYIGYTPAVDTIQVAPGQNVTHNFAIRPDAVKLSDLRVQVESEGFIAELLRRRSDNDGHFITHAELMEEEPDRITDMLRGLSNIRVRFDPDGGYFVETMDCRPYLIVNGSYNNYWRLNDFEPENILAIEVYWEHYNVPVEYRDLLSDCGAIMIWTMDQ